MRDREAKALRRKGQAGHRRRRLEVALFALACDDMRDFARRPGDRAVRPERDLIDPALLVVGGERVMFAVRIGRDELAIVAAGDDALAVGRRSPEWRRHGPRRGARRPGEQQRLLAEHEDRRRAQKMHADTGAPRVHAGARDRRDEHGGLRACGHVALHEA